MLIFVDKLLNKQELWLRRTLVMKNSYERKSEIFN